MKKVFNEPVFKFYLNEDVTHVSRFWICEKFRSEFLNVDGNKLTLKRGFKWDGCSPKITWKDLYIGTPDGVIEKFGEKNYLPKSGKGSGFHDALWKYRKELGLDRLTADFIALDIWLEDDFHWAETCFWGLQILAPAAHKIYGTWKKESKLFTIESLKIWRQGKRFHALSPTDKKNLVALVSQKKTHLHKLNVTF